MIINDAELIAGFQSEKGQKKAFEAIVQKYQVKVYGMIRKMVIDHDDADDLTQETFIRVWQYLDKFRGDSQLFTWIYRIATNECLNFLAQKKRRAMLSFSDYSNVLESKIDTSLGLSEEAIEAKLQKALLRLPDKQKLVFMLRYYDELPYEEMSKITGTSEGALKASYHHAVKKIEDSLNQD